MDSEFFKEGIFGPSYESLVSLGLLQSTFFRLTFFTIVIILYALFVFFSYKLFSKKNLFDFDFKGYVYSSHPTISSFFGFFVYLIEYIVVLPFFVIIWFSFYVIFLSVLARNLELQTVLLICTSLIAAIRVSSFTSQTLSQDLAKMLPFTLLALALTGERFFSMELLLNKFSDIPSMISSFPIYLFFIFAVEILFRFIDATKIFIFRERILVA